MSVPEEALARERFDFLDVADKIALLYVQSMALETRADLHKELNREERKICTCPSCRAEDLRRVNSTVDRLNGYAAFLVDTPTLYYPYHLEGKNIVADKENEKGKRI